MDMDMDPTYEFKFRFTNREQFYGIVRLLNNECGKGNWTIKGKVLKGLKRIEQSLGIYHQPPFTQYVEKVVVVPQKHKHVESMLIFIYKDDRIET